MWAPLFLACVSAQLVSLVQSQSVISLYVDPSSANVSAPCGTMYSSPCQNLTLAYMTIPLLSNSLSDKVTIYLSPGTHYACELSYFFLASNVTSAVATQLTIQPFNQSVQTPVLTCPVSGYKRIMNVDSNGLSISMKNVNMSLLFGMGGVEFLSSSGKNLSVGFDCQNCLFSGFPSLAFNLSDAFLNSKVGVNLSFLNCTFRSLYQALLIRGPQTQFGARTIIQVGLACHIVIQNCSFAASTNAIYVGSNVDIVIRDSSFSGMGFRALHFQPYSTFLVSNCTVQSPRSIEMFTSSGTFYKCQFSGNVQLRVVYTRNRIITFQDCSFQNVNTTSLLYSDPGLYNAPNISFTNVSFLNITGSNSASSVLLEGAGFRWMSFVQCTFQLISPYIPLLFIPTDDMFQQDVYFERCSFVSNIRLFSPLIVTTKSAFPLGSTTFNNCIFSDLRLSSALGIFSVSTVVPFQMVNCQFQNVSNIALGVFIISSASPFILNNCSFQDITATALLLSTSQRSHHISNCTFKRVNTQLQGMIRLLTVQNVHINDCSFEHIQGSVVLDRSSLRLQNCTFSSFLTAPIFNLISNSQLTTNKAILSNSVGVQGGCIFTGSNVTLNLSNSLFDHCKSTKNGGAVFVGNSSRLLCSNCTLTMNSALLSGGAIFGSRASVIRLVQSTISWNSASQDGGGMFDEGNFSMDSSFLFSNVAFGKGGGIFAKGSSSTFFNITFQNNTAESGGGAYFDLIPFQFDHISFVGNSARNQTVPTCTGMQGSGGGLFVEFLKFSEPSSRNWNFISNTANFFGGGIGAYAVVGNEVMNWDSVAMFNNSALYGWNIGTQWKTVKFFSPADKVTVLIGDPIPLFFEFLDEFNQACLGVQCASSFEIFDRSHHVGVQPSQNVFELTQNSPQGVVDLDFSFLLSSAISPIPSPNQTAIVTMVFSMDGLTKFLNFSMQICRSGYQLSNVNGLWMSCFLVVQVLFFHFPLLEKRFVRNAHLASSVMGHPSPANYVLLALSLQYLVLKFAQYVRREVSRLSQVPPSVIYAQKPLTLIPRD
jgi:hypothetical protein